MNIWMDVDTALSEVPVNIAALIDDTNFKDREESVVYNQAGMDLVWNFVTTAGVMTQTAVIPTTAGDYDWVNQGNGMYSIEIPASGGASINNDTEGYGWFSGYATGILPWRGPVIGFRAVALNNALIDGGDLLDVNTIQVSDVAQTGNDNGADINTLLSRIIGTLLTGNHNPQSGDSFSRIGALGAGLTDILDEVADQGQDGLLAEHTIVGSEGEKFGDVGTVDDFWAAATRTLTAGTKDAVIDAIKVVTDRLDALLEDVGGDRYTTKALEQAPSGTGGDATEAKQDTIISNLSTHDGKLDTVDGIVDDILIDTGTTLPAEHAALPTAEENADSVWNESVADHLSVGSYGCSFSQIPKNLSVTYYVSKDGNDSNDGRSPCTSFLTIGKALTSIVKGNTVKIGKGVYVENGLTISLDFISIIAEYGVTIASTSGQCIIISGDGNYLHQVAAINIGSANGFLISGNNNLLNTCEAADCVDGYVISGNYNYLRSTRSLLHTANGYNIIGSYNTHLLCFAADSPGTTTGFYLSANTADHNIFIDCATNDNQRCVEIITGANKNIFTKFTYSVAELDPLDNGDDNTFVAGSFIPNNVWDKSKSEHVFSGSFGEEVQLHSLSTELATHDSKLDIVDTNVDSILVNTARVDGLIEDLGGDRYTTKALEQGRGTDNALTDKDGFTLSAAGIDAILDEPIGDGAITFREVLRGNVSTMASKVSGGGTTTITYRNQEDTKDVLILVVDTNGNRISATFTP